MRPAELLVLLKVQESDSYEDIEKKYTDFLKPIKILDGLKKKGAFMMPGKQSQPEVSLEELNAAWAEIDTINKYRAFKGLPVDTTEAQAPVENKENQPLVHLTKNRATPPKRRAPTLRKADTNKTTVSTPSRSSVEPDAQGPVHYATPVPVVTQVAEKKDDFRQVEQPKETTQTRPEVQTQSPVTLDTEKLRAALISAITKYKGYHLKTEAADNRGQGAGFFSFLRHGPTGIDRAITLADDLGKKDSDTMVIIHDFMSKQTAYHHHSLTSYLADALADNGVITAHKERRYNKQDILSEMSHWSTPTSASVGSTL